MNSSLKWCTTVHTKNRKKKYTICWFNLKFLSSFVSANVSEMKTDE